MLASGGYPWTIIPLARRNDYMSALESASVEGVIRAFANFLVELVCGAEWLETPNASARPKEKGDFTVSLSGFESTYSVIGTPFNRHPVPSAERILKSAFESSPYAKFRSWLWHLVEHIGQACA